MGLGQPRSVFAHSEKQRLARLARSMMVPMDMSMANADPVSIRVAPDHYVEIGLAAQIAACCLAQDVTLGFATSLGSFAKLLRRYVRRRRPSRHVPHPATRRRQPHSPSVGARRFAQCLSPR